MITINKYPNPQTVIPLPDAPLAQLNPKRLYIKKKQAPWLPKKYFSVCVLEGMEIVSQVPHATASEAIAFGEQEVIRINQHIAAQKAEEKENKIPEINDVNTSPLVDFSKEAPEGIVNQQLDPFIQLASQMYDIPEKDVTPEQRRLAKIQFSLTAYLPDEYKDTGE